MKPLLSNESRWLIVTVQTVSKDALAPVTPAATRVSITVLIADELRVPNELQLLLSRPLPLVLFVHARKHHSFES